MSDQRTVHAETKYLEIVRYDRAGKWYLEGKNGAPRQMTTVGNAARVAARALRAGDGVWHRRRPGGSAFDRGVDLLTRGMEWS